jgi:hypothetical protein
MSSFLKLTVTVRFNPEAITTMNKSPDGLFGRWMYERMTIVQLAAIRDCPKRTTKLSESIVKRWWPTLNGQMISCVAKQPYAMSVHSGARAHNIPNAFGMGEDFGIGGRFGGFFHPGIIPSHAQPFLAKNLPLFVAV